jgi:hypothetical protein
MPYSSKYYHPGGLYLKSFAKLRVRKSATCEWYCERSLSDMRNTSTIADLRTRNFANDFK